MLKQQNEQFYANKPMLGTPAHCQCDDCQFYAREVIQNEGLVRFMQERGLHPLKADEVWCYMEENGQKHYTVDFFELYAEQPECVTFDNITMTISRSIYASEEQLPFHGFLDCIFPSK